MAQFGLILFLLSASWSLSLQAPPVPIITSITKEQVKNIGEDVQLNCTVDNVGDLAVIWSKKSLDNQSVAEELLSIQTTLILNDTRHSIQETKYNTSSICTYRINQIQAADMGQYECRVLSSQSSSSSVNLYVRQPPVISQEETPKTRTVSEGSNLAVSCIADGYPRPSISWRREYNAIMPQGWKSFVGRVLRLKPAHRLDRGGYYCIADNSIGKPDQKLIQIEVEFPPVVKVSRPNVAQVKSHTAELECSVQGYPPPRVVWYKNGTQLQMNDAQLQTNGNYETSTIATAFEVTHSTLRILSINDDSFGDYYCNATNKLGQAGARVHIMQAVIPVPTAV